MIATLTTGEIIAILGIFGGVVAFTVGLYQYYIAQKWKKSQFAAKLLEEFSNDERLATCCKLLDYSTRKLPVPSQFRQLTDNSVFLHNWADLEMAMKTEVEKNTFGWQAVLYRDLFDYFFSYLERINHYIDINLITVRDVASLEYWLSQVKSPRFVSTSVFNDFIDYYGYTGVLELFAKFGLNPKK